MRLTASTDLPADEGPRARSTSDSATNARAWDLAEIEAPVTTSVDTTKWRSRDLAMVALAAVVATLIATGGGHPANGGGVAPGAAASALVAAPAALASMAGESAASPSAIAPSANSPVLRLPAPGDHVGPGLVRVTSHPGEPREALAFQVVVGEAVIGTVTAVPANDGTVTAEVPVLGPHADVPAEIRIRLGGPSGRQLGTVPVVLVAAPPAGVWRVALVDGDRSILVTGYATLSIGRVRLTVRAGGAVIVTTETAVVGASADRSVVAPFGVGTWSAALPLPTSLSQADDVTLTLEIAWSRSPAGPAGKAVVVLPVGDGRGRG